MDRKKWQADLLMELGAFVAPIKELVQEPGRFDQHRRTRLLAKVAGDRNSFQNRVIPFLQDGPDRPFVHLQSQFQHALKSLVRGIQMPDPQPSYIQRLLDEHLPQMQTAILNAPTDVVSEVLAADSPFKAYCRIRELCSLASGQLILSDRYFDCNLFHRFLRDVAPPVVITLVTRDPALLKTPTDKTRHREFIDISREFAAERTTAHYRLVIHPDFHDRWLRVDNQIYSLGNSFRHAGRKSDCTLVSIDSTVANFAKLDGLISSGQELFGPVNPMHP